jgi:aminopeptidase N
VEAYFSKQSGKDLSKIFDQYLRTTKIPQLEYKIKGDKISFHWANCIPGFEMPVRLEGAGDWLHPTSGWKNATMTSELKTKGLVVDKNFYVTVKKID